MIDILGRKNFYKYIYKRLRHCVIFATKITGKDLLKTLKGLAKTLIIINTRISNLL